MNYDKYIALAHSSPKGIALSALVEENWSEWLALVEEAPWLRTWKRSPLLKGQTRARTPRGAIVDGWPRFEHHAIADAIYASAVWGFGLERHYEFDMHWHREVGRLKGNKMVPTSHTQTKDKLDPLPDCFKDLDAWLERYW